MSLLNVLRAGVKVADTITKPLQVTVTHFATTDDGTGRKATKKYTRRAIVDRKMRQVRTPEGVLTVSNTTLTILDPDAVVRVHDTFTLPNGDTGEVIADGGFLAPDNSKTIPIEVYLG